MSTEDCAYTSSVLNAENGEVGGGFRDFSDKKSTSGVTENVHFDRMNYTLN